MAFQTAVLVIVTVKGLRMRLVKTEYAHVQAKQLLVRNVINVLKNIIIFQVVNHVNVQLKEVSIKLAILTLEIVTVNQM